QALVPLEPRVVRVDAQLPQLDDRARREAVATDLLPGERGLLDHEHVHAVAGEVVGRGGTPRARADDQDVDVKLLARRARHESPTRLVKTFTNDANRLVKLRTNPMPGSSAAASERTVSGRGRGPRRGRLRAPRGGTRAPGPPRRTARTPRPRGGAGTSRARPRSACASPRSGPRAVRPG